MRASDIDTCATRCCHGAAMVAVPTCIEGKSHA